MTFIKSFKAEDKKASSSQPVFLFCISVNEEIKCDVTTSCDLMEEKTEKDILPGKTYNPLKFQYVLRVATKESN